MQLPNSQRISLAENPQGLIDLTIDSVDMLPPIKSAMLKKHKLNKLEIKQQRSVSTNVSPFKYRKKSLKVLTIESPSVLPPLKQNRYTEVYSPTKCSEDDNTFDGYLKVRNKYVNSEMRSAESRTVSPLEYKNKVKPEVEAISKAAHNFVGKKQEKKRSPKKQKQL